jgi:hypothetical protein
MRYLRGIANGEVKTDQYLPWWYDTKRTNPAEGAPKAAQESGQSNQQTGQSSGSAQQVEQGSIIERLRAQRQRLLEQKPR